MIVDSDKTWHFACKLNQLLLGGMKHVRVFDTEVLLVRATEEDIVAMEPWCPHNWAPLADGKFNPTSMKLTCCEHGMQIDIKDGEITRGPNGGPAGHYEKCFRFPVKVEGDRIYVRLKTPQEVDAYYAQCGVPGVLKPDALK